MPSMDLKTYFRFPMRPWLYAEYAVWGSDVLKAERCSSSSFQAATFLWTTSSMKHYVPMAAPR